MKITAHRGFWQIDKEKNTIKAFERAFQQNFGIEFDLRDYNNKIVISHDVPNSSANILLEQVIELYLQNNANGVLQCNIKSDGIIKMCVEIFDAYKVNNYVFFDMSIPETISAMKNRWPFYTRLSDYETEPILVDYSQGIWLDAFNSEWYDVSTIKKYIHYKTVSIVSPELHKRPHMKIWEKIKSAELHQFDSLILCTDYPDKANIFFNY
jgi:hypothetical protein